MRSSSLSRAEIINTGVEHSRAFNSSKPFICGMTKSSTMMSGAKLSMHARPSTPFSAHATSCPCVPKASANHTLNKGSSSTKSILLILKTQTRIYIIYITMRIEMTLDLLHSLRSVMLKTVNKIRNLGKIKRKLAI